MKFAYALNNPQGDLKKLVALYRKATSAYHNGAEESPLSDEAFDDLRETIAILDPGNTDINRVGAAPSGGKHTLPHPMPSLDKAKHGTGELAKWAHKHKITDMVISDKLDGISLMILYKKGRLHRVFTRGDGVVGRDVTSHALMTGQVPEKLPKPLTFAVRAEAIMSKFLFKTQGKDYANPRNMVAGVFNRKDLDMNATQHFDEEYISIICYEVMAGLKFRTKEKMLLWLKQRNFFVAAHQHLTYNPAKHNDEYFKKTLDDRRKKCPFQIDGLVVETNDTTQKSNLDIEDGNPASAIAFKSPSADNKAEAEVVRVEWNVSHHGYLKPRLEIKPVQLSGVTVTHATAFNAGYVRDNDIGPGAKIVLTRSGDVIPHILAVVKRAYTPQMPDSYEHGPWKWNSTNVDIEIMATKDSPSFMKRELLHFFQALEIDGIQAGMVAKFWDAGFTDLVKILALSPGAMVQAVEGIQKKSAEKLHKNIRAALNPVSLPTLMYASNQMGRNFGRKKLGALYKKHGELMLNLSSHTVAAIPGFSVETGHQFEQGVRRFKRWCKPLGKHFDIAPYQTTAITGNKFQDQVVVFTGFRSDDLTSFIESNGGVVGSGVSKKTTMVVAKDPGNTTGKVAKAHQLNIHVTSLNAFRKSFGLDQSLGGLSA